MASFSSTSLTESGAPHPGPVPAGQATGAAELFTQQTGQLLFGMGNLFIHISPFREHIDEKTGRLLVSLGNKLRSRK